MHSFGFGGTGKFSSAGILTDYGEKFGVGDTIMCCVDLETGLQPVDSPVKELQCRHLESINDANPFYTLFEHNVADRLVVISQDFGDHTSTLKDQRVLEGKVEVPYVLHQTM
ncbi:hypothetical protein D5086_022194 [Populus alba]|uniref:Uncharacterized protein n=1 Tax=Populus alba TaxID=43335 RepID=A0ACC4BEW8_POPAL